MKLINAIKKLKKKKFKNEKNFLNIYIQKIYLIQIY